MRITESRLRQIVREELTLADYKREASLETSSAEARSTILGDKNMRIRDLEEEIKNAIKKAWRSPEGLGTQNYRWYASNKPIPAAITGIVEEEQRIILAVVPNRLWFVLEFPEMSLDNKSIASIKTELSKLWVVPEGDTISNNVIRLSSVIGQVFPLTIDFPSATPPKVADLTNPIKYTKKPSDTLSQILKDYYGLPLSASNYPIYNLFANKYIEPKGQNPNNIKDGSIISLPPTVRPTGRSEMVRKKDTVS